VLKAARETETTQENIQDWLQMDEEDPEFQLHVFQRFKSRLYSDIFFIYFHQHYLNF
jgi:hypothetical protein